MTETDRRMTKPIRELLEALIDRDRGREIGFAATTLCCVTIIPLPRRSNFRFVPE
ncbi:hypothetical protein [Bradyrhizobium zhanjiangense]|uniref:hypothetical protein n=1 Tax=Bradyrhizobium zhanjiangense TaxID=1325107 RepID=UPI0013E8EA70|nr:hypothetical protein [Bradyrhizobium zhanjiangense]